MVAALGAATYVGTVLVMNPQYPLVNAQLAPPGNPAPGTPGGGGVPLGAALNLVPDGLVAVATFPPYATPRTLQAESVIFSEVPQTLATRRIGKRSADTSWLDHVLDWLGLIPARRNYQDPKPRLSILEKFVKLLKAMQAMLKRLSRNMKCLRTRLYAWSHPKQIKMLRMMSRSQSFFAKRNYQSLDDDVDEEVNSIDDCVEGIVEPLYGFSSNVTLIKDQMCIIGQTCNNITALFSNRKLRSCIG